MLFKEWKKIIKELSKLIMWFDGDSVFFTNFDKNGILYNILQDFEIEEFKKEFEIDLDISIDFDKTDDVVTVFSGFDKTDFAYLIYVFNHKLNVMKNGIELVEFLGMQDKIDCGVFWKHDLSKLSKNEWRLYAVYFYDKDGKIIPEEVREKKDDVTEKAFKHHRDNNPHHTEFYYKEDEPIDDDISDMPFESILDMFADWKTMSDFYGTDVYEWVEDSDILSQMSKKTKRKVISLLNKTEDYFANQNFISIKSKGKTELYKNFYSNILEISF